MGASYVCECGEKIECNKVFTKDKYYEEGRLFGGYVLHPDCPNISNYKIIKKTKKYIVVSKEE